MKRFRKTKPAFDFLMVVFALIGHAGCRAPKASDFKPSHLFSLDSGWPWRDEDAPVEGTPVRMVGAWTDTVLTQGGKQPQRGFGGRLMFYGPKDEKPILVDGQLVVYAFDEGNRELTDNKPTRRYVFPPDQMPLHMSKSDIGVSYSFWLPWDEAGGPKTDVSLICRFEPKGGAVVTSEQTRHMLPGSIVSGLANATKQPPKLPEGVASRPARQTLESLQSNRRLDTNTQVASFESPVDPHVGMSTGPADAAVAAPGRQMTVTSITLPDNFRLRDGAAGMRPGTATPVATPMQQQSQPPLTPIQQQPSAAGPQALPANAASGTTISRPVTLPWQAAPAIQPQTMNGLGSVPMLQPQLMSPQLKTLGVGQPVTAPTTIWSGAPAGHSTPLQPQQPQQPVQQQILQQQTLQTPAQPGMTTVSYPSYR